MADTFRICDELQSVGITANYTGYKQAVLAIELALLNEDRLSNVTKEIYWPVADSIGCARSNIERNIRTVSLRAWKVGRKRLIEIARYDLPAAPTASEFISIVASHIRRSDETLAAR